MKFVAILLIGVLVVVGVFGENDTQKHASVGGKLDLPVDDPVVNDLLKDHLVRLDTGESKVELVSIKSITRQVVAGAKYEITGSFKIGEKTADCLVSIWHRPWLSDINEKVKLKAECGGDSYTAKGDDATW